MEVTNTSVQTYYEYLFVELADPRTTPWFMMADPFPVLTIVAGYLYFVLYWGPEYMKDKKPFELKKTLIVYNCIQVISSIFLMFLEMDAWINKHSWTCRNIDHSWSPEALWTAKGMYIYHLAKISELLDTVFFILRKKNNQVSFLHVYHHTIMLMFTWVTTKYIPGGHIMFIIAINSFVHVVMYFYYMIAAMGPQYQQYLWWKKYITTIQLVQFVLTFVHLGQILFNNCPYPKYIILLLLPNNIMFYFLFADFYKSAYKKGSGDRRNVIHSERNCSDESSQMEPNDELYPIQETSEMNEKKIS